MFIEWNACLVGVGILPGSDIDLLPVAGVRRQVGNVRGCIKFFISHGTGVRHVAWIHSRLLFHLIQGTGEQGAFRMQQSGKHFWWQRRWLRIVPHIDVETIDTMEMRIGEQLLERSAPYIGIDIARDEAGEIAIWFQQSHVVHRWKRVWFRVMHSLRGVVRRGVLLCGLGLVSCPALQEVFRHAVFLQVHVADVAMFAPAAGEPMARILRTVLAPDWSEGMGAISYIKIGAWIVAVCLGAHGHLAGAQESAPSAEGSGESNRIGAARGSAATAPEAGGNVSAGGRHRERNQAEASAARAGRGGGALSHQPDRQGKPSVSSSDAQLLRGLAQAHLAEIKMASLASSISGDEAIRLYARKMLEEHYDALTGLRRLAATFDVILPGGVNSDHAALLRKQALLTGPEFDRAYLEQAGLVLHEQAHGAAQAASKAAAPEIRDYAAALQPVIEEHGRLAQAMRDDPAKASAAVRSTLKAGTGRFAMGEPADR